MIPVVFINCAKTGFITAIMDGKKQYETRTKDTLKAIVNKRIMLAETGKGKPVVKCFARFKNPVVVTSREQWEWYRKDLYILPGSDHDWKEDTTVKYLYPVVDIKPVKPFIPAEGKRHGRQWMEYNGREMYI